MLANRFWVKEAIGFRNREMGLPPTGLDVKMFIADQPRKRPSCNNRRMTCNKGTRI